MANVIATGQNKQHAHGSKKSGEVKEHPVVIHQFKYCEATERLNIKTRKQHQGQAVVSGVSGGSARFR